LLSGSSFTATTGAVESVATDRVENMDDTGSVINNLNVNSLSSICTSNGAA
jgi:hypothetical protein